jgi:DNA polymerase III subunit epsilon
MREIILDVETTGLNTSENRIVEVAAIELINGTPTGRAFQQYFNPEMDMPDAARAVHGLTDEFLKDKPIFQERAAAVLEFIGDARIVAHNATFDVDFINYELSLIGIPALENREIDTKAVAALALQVPWQEATLDKMCDHFGIDRSHRSSHGALVDCVLLAEVYAKLKEIK